MVAGIAQLGLDHQQWLGRTILDIAGEKAAIAKRGRPLVLSKYPRTITARIAEVAGLAGARLLVRGDDWDAAAYENALHYRDIAGRVTLPLPRLSGAHQLDNAALAVAMLRAQHELPVPDAALRAGMGWAEWPARLQRLEPGPLVAQLPAHSEIWLDGAHNPAAARAVADAFRGHSLAERPFYLVLGILAAKDLAGFMKPFAGRATAVYGVPVPGHRPSFAVVAGAGGEGGRPAGPDCRQRTRRHRRHRQGCRPRPPAGGAGRRLAVPRGRRAAGERSGRGLTSFAARDSFRRWNSKLVFSAASRTI